jgi:hypothetical protein
MICFLHPQLLKANMKTLFACHVKAAGLVWSSYISLHFISYSVLDGRECWVWRTRHVTSPPPSICWIWISVGHRAGLEMVQERKNFFVSSRLSRRDCRLSSRYCGCYTGCPAGIAVAIPVVQPVLQLLYRLSSRYCSCYTGCPAGTAVAIPPKSHIKITYQDKQISTISSIKFLGIFINDTVTG